MPQFFKLALYKTVFLLFFLFKGCSPALFEDFQLEGKGVCRDLIVILKAVDSREELLAAVPQLKIKFNRLVELMIETRMFLEASEEGYDVSLLNSNESEELLVQLKRVYKIEGGRTIIENAQKEALYSLDRFEAKRKQSRTPH